jgi:hypothetical protein
MTSMAFARPKVLMYVDPRNLYPMHARPSFAAAISAAISAWPTFTEFPRGSKVLSGVKPGCVSAAIQHCNNAVGVSFV